MRDLWNMLKPSAESLRNATYLPLGFRAHSDEAIALVAGLAAEVCMRGGRQNARRGAENQALFQNAVSAIVGGLLVNSQRMPAFEHTHSKASNQDALSVQLRSGLSYRPRAKESFTGERVSFRRFDAEFRGLQEVGYVESANGYRQFCAAKGDPGGFVGRSYTFRLWPTARLLQVVEEAGLELVDVRRHFRLEAPARPPVVLHALKERRGGVKVKGKRLPFPTSIEAKQIATEVNEINAFTMLHRVEVAGEHIEMAWHRAFSVDFGLHGRWYALGESYQVLPGDKRHNLITIDGEACAEVDVAASHLTCLYGHLGLPFDSELDPYDVFGMPRAVVKVWITASLGKGAALSGQVWPRQAEQHVLEKENLVLRDYPLPSVSQAVLKRHPVLADLPSQFESLGRRYGPSAGSVLSLFLMALEARVLTTAMLGLKTQGVLALPIHDSLVVPQSAVRATKQALTAAFQESLGIIPQLRVKTGASRSPVANLVGDR